ncbi:hypothetical protein FB451DRAFT_1467951, partial [Mycena latifolia]
FIVTLGPSACLRPPLLPSPTPWPPSARHPPAARTTTHRTHGHGMAISPALHPALKGPFVDSSNRSKPHTRLRGLRPSSYATSPPKSPPTRTVSLASVTASPHASPELFPAAASFVPFPNVDLPLESESEGACGEEQPAAEPWRRPRARTSHVQTPRRAQPLAPPPTAPMSKPRRPKPAKRASVALADLRFAALIERSVSQALRERSFNEGELGMDAGEGELDAQDALLAARLRASLARQGWRRPTSVSPPRWTPAARPASVLVSGSATSFPSSDVPFPAPVSTPAPAAPLLISRAARLRSGSNGTPETLPLPALVAALLLRRHNEPHASLDTGVRARVRARIVIPVRRCRRHAGRPRCRCCTTSASNDRPEPDSGYSNFSSRAAKSLPIAFASSPSPFPLHLPPNPPQCSISTTRTHISHHTTPPLTDAFHAFHVPPSHFDMILTHDTHQPYCRYARLPLAAL